MNRSSSPKNFGYTLKRLFNYLKSFKTLLFFAFLFTIVGTLSRIGANAMLSPIIDSILDKNVSSNFAKYIIVMILLVLSISIFSYFGDILFTKLSLMVTRKIRDELFVHVQKLPMSFFDTNYHGDTMSTFTNDVDMLEQALGESLSQAFMSAITVVGTLIVMMMLSPALTLVAIAMLASILLCVKIISKKSSKLFRRQQNTLAEMNSFIEEMMNGQKVVKVFNYENRNIEVFKKKNDELRKVSTLASAYGVMLMPINGNLTYIFYSLIAILGSFLIMSKSITVGNLAAFLQYTRTISRPITSVSNQLNTVFMALAGAERIFKLFDEEEEKDEGKVYVEEKNEEKYWVISKDEKKNSKVQGDVSFENIDFSYNPSKQILFDVSFYAKPNQKIALVGSTGAGKTTITNLINRFYEIDKGKIKIDGININNINKYALRSIMSIVLQDVYLFTGTIYDNIRYGRLDATDEEIVEASKLANAHHFISHMPQGYNTVISGTNNSLSQGEKQLLSIARAAIANPNIIILDEATSAIDTRMEQFIHEGMDKLMKNRTTFVIAHRLSTIRDSDAIIVIEKGKIIERGNHEDLMKLKGRYYKLNKGTLELN